jgi:NAD+ synthase (glutamine-hydrolysing)
MRIGLIQLNAKIGDFKSNRLAIQKLAESSEAELYVCPELCLSGYLAQDLFTREEFLNEEAKQLSLLCQWSRQNAKSIWVGHTLRLDDTSGVNLYNAASLIVAGEIVSQTLKSKLPNYNIFDEKRYFTPSNKLTEPSTFEEFQMLAEICEDSWDSVQKFSVDDWLHYPQTQRKFDSNSKNRLLVNLSASPFVSGKPLARRQLLTRFAKDLKSFVVYVNFSGAQDELTFDGQSAVYSPEGECLFEAPAFEQGIFVVDTNSGPATTIPLREKWSDIHGSLCTFIRDYVQKNGFQKVILGLSGGIDSALCAALCTDALGAENVLGVGLATKWTSELSRNEAKLIAKNLGIEIKMIDIDSGLSGLESAVGESLNSLSKENIQSRYRGMILMTLSNNQNRLLISTANKSEIAMGYSTLYGDMCGAMMPIGDLYKTEVYGLAHFMNHRAGTFRIPEQTLNREPSAELSDNQKDSDSLPQYAKLDAFLHMFLEHRLRFEKESLFWEKFLSPFSCQSLIRKLQINEFKRAQAPLIAKVHHRSFGKQWKMPISKAIDPPEQA